MELLLSLLLGAVRAVIEALPSTPPPDWLNDGAGYLNTLIGYGAGVGAWFPFGLAGTVLAAVLGCVVLGFTIKVVRIVASFLTAGGGSAA